MDKHLLHYKGSKMHMFIVALLTMCQGVAIISQAVFLATAITNMFNGTAATAVLPYFLGFAITFIFRHLLQWFKGRLSYRFAEETSADVQSQLIHKLFELGPRGIGTKGSGNIITLTLEGIPHFRTYLELFIPRAIAMFLIPVVILIYVFKEDLLSGIVLTLTMPIMIAFLILLGLVAKKHATAQWRSYQLLSRHFVDSLRGLLTLKYLGKSKSHETAIGTVSNKYRVATNKALRLAFLSTFSLDFFSSLSVAVVAVELGLRLINGEMGLQAALMILILAPEYFQPIRDLGNDYHATMDGKDAGSQIHKLLAVETTSEQDFSTSLPKWNGKSSLTVQRLTKVSEAENKKILKDVSFQVNGNKKVGIIGSSGAGKSTLIDLLSGFSLPTSGSFKINDTSLDFSSRLWQEQLIYIPQHPYIFSGTVAENISLYAPDTPIEKIKEAANITGLTELINILPNGLDEKIGQGGRVLSGGEEQRIALTRSLLQERPIMLFDEPTAHLDIETEHEIKQMMLPLLEDKLVFFATHRLHWMREMDIIFVIENGEIVETGTHDELYKRNGAYFRLIQAQRGGKAE
ncbi:thiol reductant ABC exporter subunit CydD [Bacillus tuaregi]|uniref:thiol reductant ABC exporter subunit CydD n=1 Tax=Bacillus tuaregi TaxID=1816695 RepID=UPI0008F9058A|nr:thiol reductant ABC exporter subunit CydD [Bacillus tuaregi]